MNQFAKNLRFLRKSKGMSQADLSEILKTTGGSISNWETGKATPSLDDILVISEFFNVELSDLVSTELDKENLEDYISGDVQEPNHPYLGPHMHLALRVAVLEEFIKSKFPDFKPMGEE